jgi:hypothetical protein
VNLIADTAATLVQQCETSLMLDLMEEAEVELVCYTMDLLVECVQGPCAGNQEQLVFTDGFVDCLDKMLQSPFNKRVRPKLLLSVKAGAVMLLASCLEGRCDLQVHKFLAAALEPLLDELRTLQLRSCRAASPIAGLQRSARSPGGLTLRVKPTETSDAVAA